jgi:hypothetical protein
MHSLLPIKSVPILSFSFASGIVASFSATVISCVLLRIFLFDSLPLPLPLPLQRFIRIPPL